MIRDLDLLVNGATGFTGRLAADYLARSAPPGLRWGIAGRDRARLVALGLNVPVVVADAAEPEQIADLPRRSRVVLNMAGPFARLGDPLVGACIAEGSHYCDISGETARIARLTAERHDAAVAARVKVVNFCGVSSLPADLAVHIANERLGGRLVEAIAGIRIGGGSFNGGTVASIAEAIESGDAAIEADPFLLGPTDRAPSDFESDRVRIHRDPRLDAWVTASPLGRSDTRAVRRSAALRSQDVRFQEYMTFIGDHARLKATLAMLGFALLDAAFAWGPSRALLRRGFRPGTGPSAERRDNGFFELDLYGIAGDGRSCRVSLGARGDPANAVTVLCACETAIALASGGEALPETYGVLTPSVAAGGILEERLRGAGVRIDVT